MNQTDPFEAYREAQGAVIELRSREHELEQDRAIAKLIHDMDEIVKALWFVVLILIPVITIVQIYMWIHK